VIPHLPYPRIMLQESSPATKTVPSLENTAARPRSNPFTLSSEYSTSR
jgi:hypothetical protein